MCLIINPRRRPSRNVYRWKFLETTYYDKSINSPSKNFICEMGKWHTALPYSYDKSQEGFHVYLSKKNATEAAKIWGSSTHIVAKLKVSGFLTAGKIDHCDHFSDGKIAETWRRAKIVALFNVDGKNITKQYFR